jgi:hypothetical protein
MSWDRLNAAKNYLEIVSDASHVGGCIAKILYDATILYYFVFCPVRHGCAPKFRSRKFLLRRYKNTGCENRKSESSRNFSLTLKNSSCDFLAALVSPTVLLFGGVKRFRDLRGKPFRSIARHDHPHQRNALNLFRSNNGLQRKDRAPECAVDQMDVGKSVGDNHWRGGWIVGRCAVLGHTVLHFSPALAAILFPCVSPLHHAERAA